MFGRVFAIAAFFMMVACFAVGALFSCLWDPQDD